jgi:hypothetical protein
MTEQKQPEQSYSARAATELQARGESGRYLGSSPGRPEPPKRNAYRFQAERTWEEVAAYADLPLADVQHAGRRGDLVKLLYERRPDLFAREGL